MSDVKNDIVKTAKKLKGNSQWAKEYYERNKENTRDERLDRYKAWYNKEDGQHGRDYNNTYYIINREKILKTKAEAYQRKKEIKAINVNVVNGVVNVLSVE